MQTNLPRCCVKPLDPNLLLSNGWESWRSTSSTWPSKTSESTAVSAKVYVLFADFSSWCFVKHHRKKHIKSQVCKRSLHQRESGRNQSSKCGIVPQRPSRNLVGDARCSAHSLTHKNTTVNRVDSCYPKTIINLHRSKPFGCPWNVPRLTTTDQRLRGDTGAPGLGMRLSQEPLSYFQVLMGPGFNYKKYKKIGFCIGCTATKCSSMAPLRGTWF